MNSRTNVSFGAVRINPVTVQKKAGKTWKSVEANFVRLNPKFKSDMESINGIDRLWHGANMSGAIAEEAAICKDPVYAITTQKDNFKNIDPKQVLGIFTTDKLKDKNGAIEIFKIGVAPSVEYSLGKRLREFKGIGKKMVQEFVKVLKNEKQIDKLVMASEPENVKFYQKIGMKPSENSVGVFELKKEGFDTFLNN